MSSDADYAAFLDKANQDTGAATAQTSKKVGTKAVDTAVPGALEGIEAYYISDADEPFEPVALKFEGGELGADELKKLIGHDAEVEEIKESEFDPRGQYKQVLEGVKKAGNGGVKVFRVELGRARAEYWVVSHKQEEGKLVGLKALAVES
jgi:hypothetical protein